MTYDKVPTIAPATIEGPLRSLIDRIVPGGVPEVVPIRYAADTEAEEVLRQSLVTQGWSYIPGFSLTERAELHLSAESQSVLSAPTGELVFIDSPNEYGPAREALLFLRDSCREPGYVRSYFATLVSDRIVGQYIALREIFEDFLLAAQREQGTPHIRISPDSDMAIAQDFSMIGDWLAAGVRDASPCPRCGSGRPYSECCSARIDDLVEGDRKHRWDDPPVT